ncbi:MAG: ATP-binding cassette domain-containing protein [Bdellovibrionales bacterium]|nr:ATP-binding cassette domain-containing protein [Bdellovibrionales bacterium]
MFEARSLSHKYNETLFNDFNLALNSGERVTLIGPSGQGKSTLAKIFTGHIKPQKGDIFLNSTKVTGQPNKKMILVDQEDDLFPWLQVEKQLFEFCKDDNLVNQLLELIELEKDKNLYPSQLSGGMKKRLSLARGLCLRPQLIVFDETFSSLDPEMRERILKRMDQYLVNSPIVSVYISHNMDILENFVSRSINIC